MKALLIIFSLLLILLLVGLWVGPGSYPDRWRTEDRTTVQQTSNIDKKVKIKKIQAELDDAASGQAAIEERARSELGMTKKGETFYEVILQPKNKAEKKIVIEPNSKKQKPKPANE
jgi:cell division protein FtsB